MIQNQTQAPSEVFSGQYPHVIVAGPRVRCSLRRPQVHRVPQLAVNTNEKKHEAALGGMHTCAETLEFGRGASVQCKHAGRRKRHKARTTKIRHTHFVLSPSPVLVVPLVTSAAGHTHVKQNGYAYSAGRYTDRRVVDTSIKLFCFLLPPQLRCHDGGSGQALRVRASNSAVSLLQFAAIVRQVVSCVSGGNLRCHVKMFRAFKISSRQAGRGRV